MTKIITNPCINSIKLGGIPATWLATNPPTRSAPNKADAKIIAIGFALARIAIPKPSEPIVGLNPLNEHVLHPVDFG